jgi:hypothetical protein
MRHVQPTYLMVVQPRVGLPSQCSPVAVFCRPSVNQLQHALFDDQRRQHDDSAKCAGRDPVTNARLTQPVRAKSICRIQSVKLLLNAVPAPVPDTRTLSRSGSQPAAVSRHGCRHPMMIWYGMVRMMARDGSFHRECIRAGDGLRGLAVATCRVKLIGRGPSVTTCCAWSLLVTHESCLVSVFRPTYALRI